MRLLGVVWGGDVSPSAKGVCAEFPETQGWFGLDWPYWDELLSASLDLPVT